jgi:hypothetical protein
LEGRECRECREYRESVNIVKTVKPLSWLYELVPFFRAFDRHSRYSRIHGISLHTYARGDGPFGPFESLCDAKFFPPPRGLILQGAELSLSPGFETGSGTARAQEMKMRIPRIHQAFAAYLVAILCALVVAACGGGGGSDGGGTADGGGAQSGATLGVMLTDAPACGFDEVNVTVRKVRIHKREDAEDDDNGWTEVNIDPPRKINLLDLNNGVAEALGEGPIGPGTYLQFRLVLVPNDDGVLANSVVRSRSGRELPLETSKKGIKLVHRFTVGNNERADVLLDFNACKSVVKRGHGHRHGNRDGRGTYSLKPVIKITPFLVDVNGINGVIAPALLGSNVVISAQRDGAIVQSTAPNPQSGEFTLARLDAGDYDVVVTADGRATALIRGVPVASSSSTATIGTSAQPFTLPASAAHTISGTITLNPASPDTVVFVTAKQTIASGASVLVDSDAADLEDGEYALTLPAGAPLVGNYGSGALPIALAPVPTAAGQYFIEASAPGYTTQFVTKNLSSADVTQNATLVP